MYVKSVNMNVNISREVFVANELFKKTYPKSLG